MALVAHSEWPAFSSMRTEGVPVVTPEDAARSSLPDLSIGLANLMPDAALRATDRQFTRLVSAHADDADLWVYPFTVAAAHRGGDARRHIYHHYFGAGELRRRGLDALIVTGANPVQHQLFREVFWEELVEVLDWARDNVASVLCSCLATHAVLERDHGITRTRLPQKRWGVYQHQSVARHPLTAGLTAPVVAPHSHWYDMTRAQFEAAGARVLIESDEAGVHMAASDDGFYLFFQGHPEYDTISLLKEYKREVARFYRGEKPDYPPCPANYLDDQARRLLDEYRSHIETARTDGFDPPPFPDYVVDPDAPNEWRGPGETIYRNWLGAIVSGRPASRRAGSEKSAASS